VILNLKSKVSTRHIRIRLGIIGFLLLIAAGPGWADWQADLEAAFDVVSTFDDLQVWKGSSTNAVSILEKPNDFPIKNDNKPSIWSYYYLSKAGSGPNWIDNHGVSNVWRGVGNSMRIDYANGADGKVYGPSRFACKIGNTPASGYKNQVHVFFMTKWLKDFFKTSGGSIDYHRFLKTLDVSAGFKNVRQFGTDAEYQWLSNNGAKGQVLHEYGLNAQVYNYQSFGGSEKVKIGYLTTDTSKDSAYDAVEGPTDAIIHDFVMNSKWFGIEYRIKTSNPHGAANGEFEIWIYDPETGKVVSHDLWSGIVNFEDGHTKFDHGWNKFVWGGNRYAGSYCGNGDPLCDFGPIDYFYLDDVIIDGTRIGPTYFSILGGGYVPPSDDTGDGGDDSNDTGDSGNGTGDSSDTGGDSDDGGGCFIKSIYN
jgi:hypothetical protein